jgi:hypothetical protein
MIDREALERNESRFADLDDAALLQLRQNLNLEWFRRRIQGGASKQPRGEREERIVELLAALQSRKDELREALEQVSGEWTYPDPIYRFYHQSFKVYGLQGKTLAIRTLFQSLLPGQELNPLFERIVEVGTGHTFEIEHNKDWLGSTLLITTAFFHARFFLEMAVRCIRYESVSDGLNSDLAAFLYLYNLR